MASYEYRLPVERWRQVLMNVSLGDLCNVVLVSKHMNSVASLPELWVWMKVNPRKVKENGLKELYNINRFKKVKQINLNYFDKFKCKEIERLLNEIPGSPLESANLGQQKLRRVSADLLASVVSHLHIANLRLTHLRTDQVVELLKASLSSTTLKSLNLYHVNLSKVPSELLAKSINRLQDVNLCRTDLTTVQCVALLKANLSSTTLRNLNLKAVNLSIVPAAILAKSICRLQEVNLRLTCLTTYQCVALLKTSLSSTTLTNLNLKDVNLSKVPSELLANSISRLQEVTLCATRLTKDQRVALLIKASLSSVTLKNINLEEFNPSDVPFDLLLISISRLQELNLSRTDLCVIEVIFLLKASLSTKTLKNVNLMNVDLSKVPADLLANSISRLHEVNLEGTFLTTDQCVALLNASLYTATLTNVNLEEIDLSEIPADLLANSISRLQNVNLSRTFLTTEQCVALLKASLSAAILTNVNLEWVNLSEVSSDLLANSISRLREANLHGTGLTTEQCVALLKANLSAATLKNVNLKNVNLRKVPAELLANSISRLKKVNLEGTRLTNDQHFHVLLLQPARMSVKM